MTAFMLYDIRCDNKTYFRHFNENNSMDMVIKSLSVNRDKPLSMMNIGNQIIHIQKIYSKLERTIIILRSTYSSHLIVILIVKFTALTSLLYFCCMLIIK